MVGWGFDGLWIHLEPSKTWWFTTHSESGSSSTVHSWVGWFTSSSMWPMLAAFFLQKKDLSSLCPHNPQAVHLLQFFEKWPLMLHFEHLLDHAGHFCALVALSFLGPWLWFPQAQQFLGCGNVFAMACFVVVAAVQFNYLRRSSWPFLALFERQS